MADWNTSSSRGKSAVERFFEDPKKVGVAVVGVGAVLVAAWALTFSDKKPEPDGAAVAFAPPDPVKALPAPQSGFALAKAQTKAPSKDSEADALKSLTEEAVKEAVDAPAEGEVPTEAADEAVQGEDEAGAPGKPIAQEAGWLGGRGGGGAGGGGMPPIGGVPSGSAGSSAALDGGPGAPGARGVVGGGGGAGAAAPGGAAQTRAIAGAAPRVMRGGGAGTTSGAAQAGLAAAAANRFAPSGVSGNSFSAAGGGAGAVTGGGPAVLGGGAGQRPEGGGGGVQQDGGGNPPGGTGGGGGDKGGGGGDGGPAKAKLKKEVEQDAAAVLKSAKTYKTAVVSKIMAEEKADVAAMAQRSKQAAQLLSADLKGLEKQKGRYASVPKAEVLLDAARELLADHAPRFKAGGADLAKAAKVIAKVPAQCGTKAEHATVGEGGFEVDPAGALQAHRDAVSALRRVAVSRVAVGALAADFSAGWPQAAADVKAADPKLGAAFTKTAKDLDKDLKAVVKSIPATMYPTKGGAKAAKKDLTKKLKPIRAAAEKGTQEFKRRYEEQRAAHRSYPDTADRQAAEDSGWRALEASRLVDQPDNEAQTTLLQTAETSLPALVISGGNAAEAYLESCDDWAALKRLAKAAPKN